MSIEGRSGDGLERGDAAEQWHVNCTRAKLFLQGSLTLWRRLGLHATLQLLEVKDLRAFAVEFVLRLLLPPPHLPRRAAEC